MAPTWAAYKPWRPVPLLMVPPPDSLTSACRWGTTSRNMGLHTNTGAKYITSFVHLFNSYNTLTHSRCKCNGRCKINPAVPTFRQNYPWHKKLRTPLQWMPDFKNLTGLWQVFKDSHECFDAAMLLVLNKKQVLSLIFCILKQSLEPLICSIYISPVQIP